MEPRIQYAQTADGVSIAFWTLGEGMPFVDMPPFPACHVQEEWRFPEIRGWYERLSRTYRVVRYDTRGTGLSERPVSSLSLDETALDLAAVVDALSLGRFALFAEVNSGPAAIRYAVSHPERVAHLILWCSYARGEDFLSTPHQQVVVESFDKDWVLFTEVMAHTRMGWAAGEAAHRFAGLIREAETPEMQRLVLDSVRQVDVTPLLAEVRTPTLVLHRRNFSFLDIDVPKRLVSGIPGATLRLLEGGAAAPYLGEANSVLAGIHEFLGVEGLELEAGARSSGAEGYIQTILFTDMEGSTTLTQRLGDAKAQEVLRTHNRIVRDALKAHGGSEIKHTGDGIMASFTSASRALECAIAIQRALAQHNESNPDTPIRVRIGLNAGEPVAEEEDLFGTAVQLAARICAYAEPGEILAANVVRELAAGKSFLFSDRGEVALRGFEDPVRLYEVA
jgi:class 3 adenylate cyclase/pimeloyl-ACP methyl ester carboxylesterase